MKHWLAISILVAVTVIAIVTVLVLFSLWWLSAVVAGVAIAGYVSASLSERRRLRAYPAFRGQEQLVRQLWKMTRCLPHETVITDPVTGSGLSAERIRGFLALAVSDSMAWRCRSG
jgi:hypothetical protein